MSQTLVSLLLLVSIGSDPKPQPQPLDPQFWSVLNHAKSSIGVDHDVIRQKLVAIEASGGHFEQARETAAAIKDAGRRSGALEAIAAAYALQGQADTAIALAEQTIEPDRVLYRTAMIQLRHGDSDGALRTSDKIEDPGTRARALVRLANCLLAAGNNDEARTLFARVAEAGTQVSDGFIAPVAIAQVRVGAVADSQASLRRLVKLDPTDARGQVREVALALVDAGRLGEARKLADALSDEDAQRDALHTIDQRLLDLANDEQAQDLISAARQDRSGAERADRLLMGYALRKARSKAFDSAKELAGRIVSKRDRARACLTIAELQRAAIGKEPALRTLAHCSKALHDAQDETWPEMSERAALIARLAQFQTRCGDESAAEKSLQEAQDLAGLLARVRPPSQAIEFKDHWEEIVTAQLARNDRAGARATLELVLKLMSQDGPRLRGGAASGSLAPIAEQFVLAGAVDRAVAVARLQASVPASQQQILEVVAEAYARHNALEAAVKWIDGTTPAAMKPAVLIAALRGSLSRADVADLPLTLLVDPWAD